MSLTEEQQERLKQIRERLARVANGNDLDYATSDTGTRCVGYIYEKGTGNTVAQMESLYDVMRGQLFANAKSDIEFLLSLLDSPAAGDGEFVLNWGGREITEQVAVEIARAAINSHCASELKTKAELLMFCYEYRAKQARTAATRMRDACVERVKAVPMPTHLSESGEEIVNHFRARVVRYLESLTFDQVEQQQ